MFWYFQSTELLVDSHCCRRPVAQIPQNTNPISHNAPLCSRNVLMKSARVLLQSALWDIWCIVRLRDGSISLVKPLDIKNCLFLGVSCGVEITSMIYPQGGVINCNLLKDISTSPFKPWLLIYGVTLVDLFPWPCCSHAMVCVQGVQILGCTVRRLLSVKNSNIVLWWGQLTHWAQRSHRD